MLDKTYNAVEIESQLCELWDSPGFYDDPNPMGGVKDSPFCIMMPPANVTGSLHMGHALTYTLQDVLIRFHRMQGRDAFWQPGVDHAGIATQMVVERQLSEEGLTRQELGRQNFLDRVWAWKEQSGGMIIDQLKRLGASANWSQSRFTMDEDFSKAVIKCFVALHKQGLIYRDKRLVNWDVSFQTAVSDLEVNQQEEPGSLWYIKYPLVEDPKTHVIIATTRPETMLGDTAVAVHPDDTRYAHLVGKKVKVPLVGREIPIVADAYCDPEKGSGAVKITPAHDFNDFQVGKRHNLEQIDVFDTHGCVNHGAPKAYQGLDRFVARQRVLEHLKAQGYLVKEEEITHTVPYGDRSGTIIEPRLTDQWFVDAPTMAKAAVGAVESGKTKFVPEQWSATYFEWMRNIEPWCISRQIWWGHQVPAWYGPDGKIFVAHTPQEAQADAKAFYGGEGDVPLIQDADVLDTWFSSALWPFVTLGWPEETPALANFYPTQVLVTGFDIIFFWVARMMMMGLHFMKEVPFSNVYIHPLVRDEKGQKMSKSKGNVINPLTLIEAYGADALRFTLAALSVQGRDIKLSEKRVEGTRNFVTKIWNVARYLEMNACAYDEAFSPCQVQLAVNQWVIHKLTLANMEVTKALQGYKFNDAASILYHFVWGTFCDWYIEFTKPLLQNGSSQEKLETQGCLAWCFVQLLSLLHPMMPFVTNVLAKGFTGAAQENFCLSKRPWPIMVSESAFKTAAEEIDWIIELISRFRALRAEMNIPVKQVIKPFVLGADAQVKEWLSTHGDLLQKMIRLQGARHLDQLPQGCIQLVQGATTFGFLAGDVIDLGAEQARLKQEVARLDVDLSKLSAKLENKNFVAKAPLEVVSEIRERRDALQAKLAKLNQALQRLTGS